MGKAFLKLRRGAAGSGLKADSAQQRFMTHIDVDLIDRHSAARTSSVLLRGSVERRIWRRHVWRVR